eukprot:GHVS01088196.1.p1 GENE.GHVS01088196.1~~GHVS01088196.1.p1  ORF type:complete len:125 (-),score=10.15 GHVS01088196.1:26-400(-)
MNASQDAKVFRWSLYLGQFDIDIEHIPGAQNKLADLLSRQPRDPAEEIRIFIPSTPTMEDFQVEGDAIPTRVREALLFHFHSGKAGGHQGINRTVGGCAACSRNSPPNLRYLRRALESPLLTFE